MEIKVTKNHVEIQQGAYSVFLTSIDEARLLAAALTDYADQQERARERQSNDADNFLPR